MKAYLATTGALFALLASAHLVFTITKWRSLFDEPEFIVEGPGIGAIAGALAIWAWRLHRTESGKRGAAPQRAP